MLTIPSLLKVKIEIICVLNGKIYFINHLSFQWVVLCPRKFPKILRPPLATLHKQGHISMHTWMSFIYEVGLIIIVSKML